ncbi:hypothetical protein QL285_045727 [Trifolium repens]|nr:hypothetical protein QL285_045727 [Trifolium repens]
MFALGWHTLSIGGNNLDEIPFSLVNRFVAVGLVSTSENAFEIGKFCYGIKTISVFRQVSESSLFPFKRRFQVDRLTGARTRRELMFGAELESSDLKTLVFLFVLVLFCLS